MNLHCIQFHGIVHLVASNCYSNSLCYCLVFTYVGNDLEVDYFAISWQFTFSNKFYCFVFCNRSNCAAIVGSNTALVVGSFAKCLYSFFSPVTGSDRINNCVYFSHYIVHCARTLIISPLTISTKTYVIQIFTQGSIFGLGCQA